MRLDLFRDLMSDADTKIVLLVMDGLGGLPMVQGGLTELEAADTPNLDALAAEAVCGLHQPVGAGITPGSGPSHLGLFGYDPLTFQVGRGVLSALGIDFDLAPRDLAARGNFCTVDEQGRVTDRRAGRIPSEQNEQLCQKLRKIELPDVQLYVETIKEYRFLLVLRSEGLSDRVGDTDPQETGVKPLRPKALSQEAEQTARLVARFIEQARGILEKDGPANMVLLRGFSTRPSWPSIRELFGLRAVAIAAYPMYRGVAKLVGMEEFDLLEERWDDFDFFFLHVKHMDSAGEDGDFERKAALIEEVDTLIPRLVELNPNVLVVTGDHSTPSRLKYHSWHPVPVLLWSQYCRPDSVHRFGERACMTGGLGPRLPATDIMPLALAHARRLEKFGA
jgi:2,3-bisphosphoglycerate-independent phosphoglycerate mutase